MFTVFCGEQASGKTRNLICQVNSVSIPTYRETFSVLFDVVKHYENKYTEMKEVGLKKIFDTVFDTYLYLFLEDEDKEYTFNMFDYKVICKRDDIYIYELNGKDPSKPTWTITDIDCPSSINSVVWIFIAMEYMKSMEHLKGGSLGIDLVETNLYPEQQRLLCEELVKFHNEGYNVNITTNSPYVLGTLNYCLQAGQSNIDEGIPKLKPSETKAYYCRRNTIPIDIIDRLDDLILITDETIDDASVTINYISDRIMQYNWDEEKTQKQEMNINTTNNKDLTINNS